MSFFLVFIESVGILAFSTIDSLNFKERLPRLLRRRIIIIIVIIIIITIIIIIIINMMSRLIIDGHGLYGVTVQIVTEYNQ